MTSTTPDPGPAHATVSTTFSTRYSQDGSTWTPGPNVEIGARLTGDGPAASFTPFVNVHGCGDGSTASVVEFITCAPGLASLGIDAANGRLQVSFLAAQGFAPDCGPGSYVFPVPFGPVGGVARVTYDQAGSSFTGTVYDVSGTTEYTLQGTAVAFSGV